MTQPETLRLADVLDANATNGDMGRKPDPRCHKRQAAAELRRLHEVNQELLEALKDIAEMYSYEDSIIELARKFYEAKCTACVAIAKAEGDAA